MDFYRLNGRRLVFIGYIFVIILSIMMILLYNIPRAFFTVFIMIFLLVIIITFLTIPLVVFGWYLKTFQENSIKKASNKIRKIYWGSAILLLLGIFQILTGMNEMGSINMNSEYFDIIFFLMNFLIGGVCFIGFMISSYMTKISKDRVKIYNKMFLILESKSEISKEEIEDYLDETLMSFGHKMFKKFTNEELLEDFNSYKEIKEE